MLMQIPDVLAPPALEALRGQLSSAQYVDGRASAGAIAGRVKHNLELPAEAAAALSSETLRPLYAHPQFQAATLPGRISGATFARYEPGMTYGFHTDDPVMGRDGQRFRCDVAVTLMLSEPEDFDGGALVVQTPFGEQRARPSAGTALVYPASSLHAVEPVSRGVRLVAVAWVQSMVASAEQRQLLFDLWRVRDTLAAALPDAEVSAEADRIYANLTRMWAQF